MGGNHILKVEAESLSAVTCDAVLRQFARFSRGGRKDSVVLDLSGVTFVDPYGMGMICLIARHLSRTVWDLSCRVPRAEGVRSYLARMNVLAALGPFASFEGEAGPARQAVSNEGLLEMTPITRRDDVSSLLLTIGGRVSGILTEELGYREREITAFKNVVAELCHNVLDHSFDWGYIAAQRYVDHRRGKKFAIVGVGDLGIGIRGSLALRYDVASWSHGKAIANALRRQFSRDPTRGLGLYVVNRVCRDYGGSLHIRSGDTRVYVRGRSVVPIRIASFPGTQISIKLYQSSLVR